MSLQSIIRFAGGMSATVLMLAALSASATPLIFGGYFYDPALAFTNGTLLGNGVTLGAVKLSNGVPTTVTAEITGTGLATNGSIAQVTHLNGLFKALNLPNGNNGVTTRHGVALGGGSITNLPGPDFVIMESGSTNVPEAFAVRVQDTTSFFSDWHYFAAQTKVAVSGGGVLFITPFDLSNMGFSEGTVITNVQIINLKPTDQIAGSGSTIAGHLVGEGVVDFTGASGVQPYAGPQNTNGVSIYANDQFDPDPVYLAVLAPPTVIDFQFSGAGQGAISIQSFSGLTYQLQGSADLKTWADVGPPVAGDDSVKTFNDSRPTDSYFFWRIKIQ